MLAYQDLLDIGLAPDGDALQARLAAAAAELGFGLSSATQIRGRLGSGKETVHAVFNTPPEFLEASRSPEYGVQDPFLTKVLASHGCHAYDESLYVDAGAEKLWELISAFGYRHGLAVSILEPSHLEAFSFGVDGPDPLPSDRRLRMELEANLMLVALHANEAAKRLWTPPSTVDLNAVTQQEVQALRWAADATVTWSTRGLTVISKPGQAELQRSATRKLGASSRSQAVLRAIKGGLIDR